MTSEDLHKKQLTSILKKRKVKSVLELGLEKGTATDIFVKMCDRVISLDFMPCEETRMKYPLMKVWSFIQQDVSHFLRNDGKRIVPQFDMVYYDISYYTGKCEYGTPEAYQYERQKLAEDVPVCYFLMRRGAVLVVTDFVDTCGQRTAVRDALCQFAYDVRENFTVYPNRGGLFVMRKTRE